MNFRKNRHFNMLGFSSKNKACLFFMSLCPVSSHRTYVILAKGPFFLAVPVARKVPRLGIEPTPQQQPKPQQSQCLVLNPLHHQGTHFASLESHLLCLIAHKGWRFMFVPT